MKNLSFTILFAFISLATFAQNNPQLVLEQSNKGYEVALKMDDVSKLASVKIEGILKDHISTEALNIDLNVSDVKNIVSFTSFDFNTVSAEFVVVVTDEDGNEVRYPSVDLIL